MCTGKKQDLCINISTLVELLKDSTKILILLITLLIVQSEGILEDRIYAFLGVTFKDNLGPSFKGSILNDHMRVHHNNHASGVSCNSGNCSGGCSCGSIRIHLDPNMGRWSPARVMKLFGILKVGSERGENSCALS